MSQTLTNTDIKAAQKARTEANVKAATKAAKVLLKDAPVHEFQTGSQGRFVRANLTIDGEPVTVQFQVVQRNTVVKKDAAPAPAQRRTRAKVSLVKETPTA